MSRWPTESRRTIALENRHDAGFVVVGLGRITWYRTSRTTARRRSRGPVRTASARCDSRSHDHRLHGDVPIKQCQFRFRSRGEQVLLVPRADIKGGVLGILQEWILMVGRGVVSADGLAAGSGSFVCIERGGKIHSTRSGHSPSSCLIWLKRRLW